MDGGRRAMLRWRVDGADLELELSADGGAAAPGPGLGPAHRRALRRPGRAPPVKVDHGGRDVQLGADRRYTGPDCPPEMLAMGGIPQGDYAPIPWLQSSRGYAVWVDTAANGCRFELGERDVGVHARRRRAAAPAGVHRPDPRRPAARASCSAPACRRCCPSGATASGRAATSTSTPTTCWTTSRAACATTSHWTRSCSTPPGRRTTTRGSPTPASSRTSPGWWRGCAARACARSCGSPRGRTSTPRRGRSRPTRGRSSCTQSPPPTTPRARGWATSCAPPTASRGWRAGGWAPARWSTSPPRRPSCGGGGRPSQRSRSAWRASRPTTARATACPTTSCSPTGAAARRRRGRWAACTGARCVARWRPCIPARASSSGARAGPGSRPTGCCGAATRRRTSGRCRRSSARRSAGRRRASPTGPTTSAATSATAWSSAARPSCWCAGRSWAASRR